MVCLATVDDCIASLSNISKCAYRLSGPWHCRFGSFHPDIRQFLFADGRVASLSNSTDMATLQAMAVRNDGQTVSVP
jgi:hypothetical protein